MEMKMTAEENAIPLNVLISEVLLEVICNGDPGVAPVAEVSENELSTALWRRTGVEAQLVDLTEFIDSVHIYEATKWKLAVPTGQGN